MPCRSGESRAHRGFRISNSATWDVELLETDPNITSITSDGRSICWYGDVDKTAKSIEVLSSADAGRLALRRLPTIGN